MSLLLDDLLDVSRITRGTLELRRQPTELAAIVEAAVETARPAIDAKRHELLVDIPIASRCVLAPILCASPRCCPTCSPTPPSTPTRKGRSGVGAARERRER